MQTLENLKRRLLVLPAVREGRQHEERYAAFLAKTAPARDKLTKTSAALDHAPAVLPSAGYAEPRKATRTSASIALRLREKLTAEPATVAEDNVEKSFARLFANADSALSSCQLTWQIELQNKIKDWETIADVIAKLVKTEGARLQRAIASIRAAKAALPQTAKASKDVQDHLDDLKDSVSKLGLKTEFGKFLQAAASPAGADLSMAQADEVSKMIKQYSLEKVFRIRLSA